VTNPEEDLQDLIENLVANKSHNAIANRLSCDFAKKLDGTRTSIALLTHIFTLKRCYDGTFKELNPDKSFYEFCCLLGNIGSLYEYENDN
jgi:hypothetical protein